MGAAATPRQALQHHYLLTLELPSFMLGTQPPCWHPLPPTRAPPCPPRPLQRAICDAFGICINVITSDADNWWALQALQPLGRRLLADCGEAGAGRSFLTLAGYPLSSLLRTCPPMSPFRRTAPPHPTLLPTHCFLSCRFLRYLPSNGAVAVQHEVFLTYIAPIHYNAIRHVSAA